MAKNNSKGSLVGAALAGAAVGATAVFLADEKNRNKASKTVAQIKKSGKQKIQKLQARTEKAADKSKKKIASKLEKAEKRLNS